MTPSYEFMSFFTSVILFRVKIAKRGYSNPSKEEILHDLIPPKHNLTQPRLAYKMLRL